MGPPQLNIKDAETSRLVRELAELTGETQTEAVKRAVRQRLEHEKDSRDRESRKSKQAKERDIQRRVAEIRKIQADVREVMTSSDFLTDDDLYDERGLPK
jgi:antitoxin VapB